MRLLSVALAASLFLPVSVLAENVQKVIVAPAITDRFVDRVEALGTSFSNESVVITANVPERVTEILFEDGQTVEEGQLLVAMRRDEQKAELAAAEAVLTERRTAYERARELERRQFTATAQLEERLAALRQAEANRDAAASRLAFLGHGVVPTAARRAFRRGISAGQQISEQRVASPQRIMKGSRPDA